MFVVGGESLIDLKAEVTLADSRTMGRDENGQIVMTAHVGGSSYNCAIALAKLGNPTGFLCPISMDAFGEYLLAPLVEAGVETLLGRRVKEFTTLAVVNFDSSKNARYGFYRHADGALNRDEALAALPEIIEAYQIGGFCPIEPKEFAIWLAVVREASARGAVISIDPNVRPSLVDDFESYRERLSIFLDMAHIIKVSREDLEALDAEKSIEQHAKELLERPACELVIVTAGEDGSSAYTASSHAKAAIFVPSQTGDTVGAGDSLMAAILSWLHETRRLARGSIEALTPDELASMLRFGAVVAGINCGRRGCKPPTRAEVDAVMAADHRRDRGPVSPPMV